MRPPAGRARRCPGRTKGGGVPARGRIPPLQSIHFIPGTVQFGLRLCLPLLYPFHPQLSSASRLPVDCVPASFVFIRSSPFRVFRNITCILWTSFPRILIEVCELFPGLRRRDLLYIFRAAGGGVEGFREKTCPTLDYSVIWGHWEF